tara:strand:- start:301 stop:1428 length:1128 start_codon:yes stop_codon:yes gene_type:complete
VKDKIPLSKPSLSQQEITKIAEVFQTGWLGMGSETYEFEKKIQKYLGAREIIATNTGTSALHLALDSYGIQKDDEVIVPSLTYAASIQVILSTGAIPVFCESRTKDLSLDIQDVKRRITKHTKAIMPVHYCGKSCDMDELLDIADSNDIIIIEDAAHAFGSKYKDQYIGSFGHATCFSFDPIKVITCGEGGAVTTNNDKIADIMRKKRILGIDKETWFRYKGKRQWTYDVTEKGYRYHMPNFCAAIGIAQLKKIETFIEKRREICIKYDENFKKLKTVRVLEIDYKETVPFIYILRIKSNLRNLFIEHLKQNNVDTGIHYIPNHYHTYFKQFVKEPLPMTDIIAKQIVTIPLFIDISSKQIQTVINSVLSFDEKN